MTEPAIKAALAEAALAVSEATLDWGDEPPEIWDSHRTTAAEAIAAFLRALPVTGFGYAGTLRVGPHVADTVADLVEAAAREGGG
jgi:hypothetical protein